MIELRKLSKIYNVGDSRIKALDDIDFVINKGEFIGITGSSGNGKTTLINTIGGLLRPTVGDVYVNGVELYKMKDGEISKYRNKTIGFIFQNYNLLEGVTALENVMLPLVIGRIKHTKRKRMAEEALSVVGLKDRMYHKPEELSGGQKQRVAIARAIVNSPEIIIADEPTGNLDDVNTYAVMNILEDINKKGVTILMVTHNENLKKYFTRKITVDKGKIYV